MSSVSGFTDVNSLPELPIGNNHTISYAGHHVIATDTFNNSPFLKALQANGLWNQSSFASNGVPLVQAIDGVTASTSHRDIVGGALQTGPSMGPFPFVDR